MSVYAEIIEKVIRGQEAIIGPVAVEQAQRVAGLKLDWDKHQVVVEGDEAKVVDDLIAVYKELFGQISVEVSKESAASLIGQLKDNEVPQALR